VHIHSERLRQEWLAFRGRYVAPEGRVVDTGNGNVSHSEGQGWGMMAAQAADDRDSFTLLYGWTKQTLQRRPYDRLHAWRYRPGLANPVSDLNNATDGDLFIAAALARAAARWNRPDYAEAAAHLATDILQLTRTAGLRTILLPGADGFEKRDCFNVNPSYYAFGLFDDLAPLAPSRLWSSLRQDGTALLLQGRFGRFMLPPDWLRVDRADGSLSPAPGWPPRFSWDAIRVPLHVTWGGLPAAPLLEAFGRYWAAGGGNPAAWTDLRTGELAPYAAPPGMRAVAALALRPINVEATPALPSVMAASDYYGAGLVLLSRIAAEETGAPGV
jgi:endoglucanase